MLGLRAAALTALLLSAAGCVPRYVVPEQLEPQVDRSVGFSQLRQDAARHVGASVVLGGSVLDAKLVPEGTRIEVLQLPLDAADRPSGAPEHSEGRFLLIDPQRTDPAVLQQRLVTVVGEVLGTKVEKVDEAEYTYPWLSARFIHVWRGGYDYPPGASSPYYYPYYYPYYAPYSYPYAPYYYSPYLYGDPFYWSAPYFYGSYYYYGSGGSSHRDSPPRRFEPPSGGGAPPPSAPPPASPRPPSGGGGGRIFK
jgi:outer membrane lipoprotein